MVGFFILLKGGDSLSNIHGIVYCATNLINGKKYIGQTVRDLERRKQEHISSAYRDGKYTFHKAIVKYGEDNFKWEVLYTAETIEELDEKEIYWIDYYNTYGHGGYNESVGGQFRKRTNDNADLLSEQFGGREFLVFDLDGNLVESTVSQTAFADKIGVSVQSVNNVLRGIKNSVKDYILIFKEKYSEELLKERIDKTIKTKFNKVFYVFSKNQDYIGKWDNREICQNEIGVSRRTITRLLDLNNHKGRTNYLFYYESNVPKNLKNKII